MRIVNKTKYDTRDLRKLFCEALRRNEKIEGKLLCKHRLDVWVVYSREDVSGQGRYSGGWIKIRLPHSNLNPVHIAYVFEHEVQHNRGFRHNRYDPTLSYCWTKDLSRWEWAKDYQIREKQPRVKPKQDLQLKRYAHTKEMVEKKEKQLKRLQKQLKKWKQKERYYERVLTAAGKIERR